MSHEVSVTVEVDGRWINLASVVDGKNIGQAEAVRRFKAGKQNALGGRSFSSAKSAADAAHWRSNPKRRPGRNPFKGIK